MLAGSGSYVLENTAPRATLIAAGKERARRFSCHDCARRTLALLTSLQQTASVPRPTRPV